MSLRLEGSDVMYFYVKLSVDYRHFTSPGHVRGQIERYVQEYLSHMDKITGSLPYSRFRIASLFFLSTTR